MQIRTGLIFIGLGLSLLLAGGCFERGAKPQSVSGTIETDEARVASRYGGRVEKIFANEGDALKTGQVIVKLEAAELQAKRDQAVAQLAEYEAGWRKEEIEGAKNEWEALVSQLEQARADDKRAGELFPQNAISKTEREQAETHARMIQSSMAAARNRYDMLLAGTRPERVAMARAQLAEIEANLREMTVAAPTNCVLEVLNVKVGDVVAPNREVATLLLTNHIWVRVYVPEPWVGHIKLGDPVKVRVDSDPGRDFSGQVEQVARQAEFTPRNVQTIEERIKQVFGIKVRLDNTEGKLRAGMAADVTFPNVPRT